MNNFPPITKPTHVNGTTLFFKNPSDAERAAIEQLLKKLPHDARLIDLDESLAVQVAFTNPLKASASEIASENYAFFAERFPSYDGCEVWYQSRPINLN